MGITIGVDFDNTIAGYDKLIHEIAIAENLIDPSIIPGKKIVRDAIRCGPDGETRWRHVQAKVYGPEIRNAVLIDGVWDFFVYCGENRIQTYIVSHKTKFASAGDTGVNLREAALGWMKNQQFFGGDGLGIDRSAIYFESTRLEKIERIRKLGCTHFIDDLEETFSEESWPEDVIKILFSPCGKVKSASGALVVTSWRGIYEYFFKSRKLA